jgi:hypothetical protein
MSVRPRELVICGTDAVASENCYLDTKATLKSFRTLPLNYNSYLEHLLLDLGRPQSYRHGTIAKQRRMGTHEERGRRHN